MTGAIHTLIQTLDLLAITALVAALSTRLRLASASGDSWTAARLSKLICISLLLLSANSLWLLLEQVHGISGAPYSEALRIAPHVLLNTHYGNVWLIRPATLFGLWSWWNLARKGNHSRRRFALMLGATAVLAFTAVMTDTSL